MDLETQRILVNAGCTIIGALIATITTAIINHRKNKAKTDIDVIKNVKESVIALQNTMEVSQKFTEKEIKKLIKENETLASKNEKLELELTDIKKELKALRAIRCFNYSCPKRVKELPDINCEAKQPKKK